MASKHSGGQEFDEVKAAMEGDDDNARSRDSLKNQLVLGGLFGLPKEIAAAYKKDTRFGDLLERTSKKGFSMEKGKPKNGKSVWMCQATMSDGNDKQICGAVVQATKSSAKGDWVITHLQPHHHRCSRIGDAAMADLEDVMEEEEVEGGGWKVASAVTIASRFSQAARQIIKNKGFPNLKKTVQNKVANSIIDLVNHGCPKESRSVNAGVLVGVIQGLGGKLQRQIKMREVRKVLGTRNIARTKYRAKATQTEFEET